MAKAPRITLQTKPDNGALPLPLRALWGQEAQTQDPLALGTENLSSQAEGRKLVLNLELQSHAAPG